MAASDVYSGLSAAVANNAYLSTQPGAGVEAVITNIYYDGPVEIYFYDGATEVGPIYSDTTALGGSLLGCSFHVNNARYIRIKNVAGSAKDLAYDGVQTK